MHSDFVVPSNVPVESEEDRKRLKMEYLMNKKDVVCKYGTKKSENLAAAATISTYNLQPVIFNFMRQNLVSFCFLSYKKLFQATCLELIAKAENRFNFIVFCLKICMQINVQTKPNMPRFHLGLLCA